MTAFETASLSFRFQFRVKSAVRRRFRGPCQNHVILANEYKRVFQQSFDDVDNLEALEINLSNIQ